MAIDLFEMKKTNGTVLWVRDKKKAKQLNKSSQGGSEPAPLLEVTNLTRHP
jgi:hypothetical protein